MQFLKWVLSFISRLGNPGGPHMPERPSPKTAERPSYPLTIFAVRLRGRKGWIVQQEPHTVEEIERQIRLEGHDLEELRVISRGTGFRFDADGKPDVGLYDWMINSHGWSFDERADCWRAPGENLTEPDGDGALASDFTVRGERPHSGWWDIHVSANGQTFETHASNVFDPIPDLRAWLEAIVRGESARVLIDEEGEYTDLCAYPRPDGMCRVVVYKTSDSKPIMDIRLSGRQLVGSFYAAMHTLSTDEALFRDQWQFHLDAHHITQPPFSSDIVEAFLAGH